MTDEWRWIPRHDERAFPDAKGKEQVRVLVPVLRKLQSMLCVLLCQSSFVYVWRGVSPAEVSLLKVFTDERSRSKENPYVSQCKSFTSRIRMMCHPLNILTRRLSEFYERSSPFYIIRATWRAGAQSGTSGMTNFHQFCQCSVIEGYSAWKKCQSSRLTALQRCPQKKTGLNILTKSSFRRWLEQNSLEKNK